MLIITLCSHFCLSGHTLAEDASYYFSIISENDIYAPKAQDRHYSNGLRIAFGLTANRGNWYEFLGDYTALKDDRDRVQYELALGQNIYTPEFYLSEELAVDDRPYAGWLYGELAATSHAPGVEESITINAGIVGPAALGEQFQKFNHSIIGDEKPRGWNHQLKNEPAISLRYRRSRFTALAYGNALNLDTVTRFGIGLGNVFTDAAAGLVLRAGNHLPERDLPVRAQPGLSGNSTYVEIRKDHFDWMVFTEIQGRAVLHNIFLDGNLLRESHSIAKKPFVWDAATGVVFGFGKFRYPLSFSFSLVWRGKEFHQQRGVDNFGSAQIGLQF